MSKNNRELFSVRFILLIAAGIILLVALIAFIYSVFGPKNTEDYNIPTSGEDYTIEASAYAIPDNGPRAEIVSGFTANIKTVCLTFNGLSYGESTEKILDMLDGYGITASFFVSGSRIAEEPLLAEKVSQRGHTIGNYTLTNPSDFDSLTIDEMSRELYRNNRLIYDSTKKYPEFFRCSNSTYGNSVLSVAASRGIAYAVPDFWNVNSNYIESKELADEYVTHLDSSAIISVSIQNDEKADNSVQLIIESLINAGYSFKSLDSLCNEGLITITNNYKSIIEENEKGLDYTEIYTDEEEMNNRVMTFGYTTQKSVSLTFDGLGSEEMLDDILLQLDACKIRATFFIPANRLEISTKLAKKILAAGHELESNTYSARDLTLLSTAEVNNEITKAAHIFSDKLGFSPKYIRPANGRINPAAIDAAENAGQVLVTYSKNPLDKDMKSADSIMEYLTKGLMRGEIILLNADTNSAVIDVIPRLAEYVRDIGYDFVTIDELYNSQYTRMPLEQIPGWDAINVNPNPVSFTNNTVYEIPTGTQTVFLSFDDWGTDKTITSILNTLDRYNIKASFFLRMKGAKTNPNLVRAIGEAGHTVASHTYSHTVISNMSVSALQSDLVKAHQTLTESLGRCPDLYFRPPQLAVSNEALSATKAAGYNYVIQSHVSTHDWDSNVSHDDILSFIDKNIEDGSIIVLHLLDDASGWEVLPDVIEMIYAKGYSFGNIKDYLK